ncbi:MAG: hypothetical protein ACKOE6_04535 [Flammeovirgaceae bacterium]
MSTFPISKTILTAGLWFLCASCSSQSVKNVIDKYISLVGSRPKIDSLATSFKKSFYYSLYGTKDTIVYETVEKKSVGYYAKSLNLKGILTNEHFANKFNGVFVSYRPVLNIVKNEKGFVPDQVHPAQEILRLEKKNALHSVQTDSTLNGDSFSIRAKLDDKTIKTFYFDMTSGLLIATRTSNLPNNLETFADYRRVGDILFPFYSDVRQFDRILSKSVFHQVVFNTTVENILF